ncbi:ABC transporter substrate-binding protein [bacterium]|nr:ABC transporter substrate-binding protein [bacterium]
MKQTALYKFLVVNLLLAACTPTSKERDPKVFRYNEASGISSLDPAFARVQSNIWAVGMLFNTLVELDSALQLKPGLAVRWDLSDDGLEYRFKLRSDVWFHRNPCFDAFPESRRLRASDVVFSLNRLKDPVLASPGIWIVRPIDSTWALGTDSVIVRLKEPFPPFLSTLANAYCGVVSQRAAELAGSEFGRQPVGSGPFAFKRWIPNEKMVLRRHPDYFETDAQGQSLPYLESVSIRFLPDRKSSFLALLQGQVDFISGLDPSYADELLDASGQLSARYRDPLVLLKAPYLNTEYLGFGLEALQGTPYANPEVRKAVGWSIDREALVRYLRRNVGIPARGGMLPNALEGSIPMGSGWQYDPEQAAEALRLAGYPGGVGLPPLVLHTGAEYLDIAEFVQSSAQRIGIPFEIEVMPSAALREGMANARFGFFRGSWIADYPESENYLALFYSPNYSPNGPNYTHFTDPSYDADYEALRGDLDRESRRARAQSMEARLLESAPVLPLWYDEVVRCTTPEWRGLTPDPLNRLDLRRVRWIRADVRKQEAPQTPSQSPRPSDSGR